MSNENEFRFWVESDQAENCTILLKERESLYDDLIDNIKNAKDGVERASVWWSKLFRGTIKDDQGNIHYLCNMDMSHVYSSPKTPSLCGVLLSKYREELFNISGNDSRIIILNYDKNDLLSKKPSDFYGPYDDKLVTNQYGALTKQFGDEHDQDRLLKWVREDVLKLKDNLSTGQNLIIYGAPGTGKSYWVNHYDDERQNEKIQGIDINTNNIIRVVFHPEYTCFDFVGSYRPKPKDFPSKDANNECVPYITYEFVPGPFTKVLVKALKDSNNMYTLLIEELNRADAAAVFGDVFQLLDRNENGKSEYPIEPSEEWLSYFEEALKDCEEKLNDIKENGVSIPSNMNIIATMNSADQGVHLLDTAFKRRWRYKYISVDQAIKNVPSTSKYKTVKIIFKENDDKDQAGSYFWLDFINAINEKLGNNGIPEDRWIGPYFATEQELENDGEAAIEKVLFYLWDDVLRNSDSREQFFGNDESNKPKCLGDLIEGGNYKKKAVIHELRITPINPREEGAST